MVIPSALVSALVSIATLSIWNNHIDLSDPRTRESIREIVRPEPWTKIDHNAYAEHIRDRLETMTKRLDRLEEMPHQMDNRQRTIPDEA